jgi:tryptophanyl-tRNA synthetase
VIETLNPIRHRYHDLISDRAELDRILALGAERAGAVARRKVEQVKERVGFIVP